MIVNRFVKIHQSNKKMQDVFGSFFVSVSCYPQLQLPSANNDRLIDTAALILYNRRRIDFFKIHFYSSF